MYRRSFVFEKMKDFLLSCKYSTGKLKLVVGK